MDSINSNITNENNETFNFGVLNGVRGFFTNPSRADDSFVPFKNLYEGTFTSIAEQDVTVNIGFRPSLLIVESCYTSGAQYPMLAFYYSKRSTTKFIGLRKGQSSWTGEFSDIGVSKYYIRAITDTGFVFKTTNASATARWIAMK